MSLIELFKRIKNRREELNMSQEELAKKLGYKSRSSINKIEKGENDIPQSKIAAFAAALETTPEYLMGWETPAPEPSPSYYVDPETAELADRLKNQPGMRMLFDASRKASPKDLEIAANLLKQLKGEE